MVKHEQPRRALSLTYLKNNLRSRHDSEHEQAFLRLILGGAFCAYVITVVLPNQ